MALMLLCRDVPAFVATDTGIVVADVADTAVAAVGLQLCITHCLASTDGGVDATAAAAGDVEITTGPLLSPPGTIGAAGDPEFTRTAAAIGDEAERELAKGAALLPAVPPAAVDIVVVAAAWDIEPSSKSKISDVDSECIGFFIDSPIF